MPQPLSNILEKNTTKISTRIEAINRFIENSWDVHINYSPVVYYKNWKEDYLKLFEEVNNTVKYKEKVKCEVIMLTHNKNLHDINLQKGLLKEEQFLWIPSIQEEKISQYGGNNVRYKKDLKSKLIEEFKELHNKNNSWCTIRYIF